ncbi:hypothetical protein [Lysobacter sp. TY2-98]|uniref:hypothetical protein n=1 Tax=Lysobacter sp. TY2-98 TaxID=2290922 RepID=UPI0013B3EE8D|nr:hypothetical protein [Lysobacter sp. TY2-98]
MHPLFKSITAVVGGALAAVGLLYAWPHIAAAGLVFHPLWATGLRGEGLLSAVHVGDFLVSMVLLLPLALLLRVLGTAHPWRDTFLACLSLVATSAVLVGSPSSHTGILGVLLALSPAAALLADVWLCVKITGRAPNNSSKPTPLRGAA